MSTVRWNLEEAECQGIKQPLTGKIPNRRTETTYKAVQEWTNVLNNTKSNAARIPCGKCGGYMGGKLLLLPEEILQAANREKIQKL